MSFLTKNLSLTPSIFNPFLLRDKELRFDLLGFFSKFISIFDQINMKIAKHFFTFLLLALLFFSGCKGDDTPIEITISDITVTMDENPTNAQTVISINASVTSGQISFSIKSQTPTGAFSVDSSTGQLTVADPSLFDFETNPTLTLVVTATSGAISKDATITVSLNNVLETVTTSDETVTIDENPAQDFQITTVSGTTDLGSVSFSLVNESVSGAFSINQSSGALTVANASLFDFEVNPSLTATVNVTNASITQTAIITVNLNDIFEVAWTQATGNAAFGARYDHRIVSFNGKLWAIGGIVNITRQNDVWSSTDGITWTKETTVGNIFSPRNGHQLIVFNNKMWLIGGFTANGRSNEIWSSADGINWTLENISGSVFSARADHSAVVYDNKIWVIGGSDGNFQNDVWNSADGTNWNNVTTAGTIFSKRLGHTITNFGGKLVLIGGSDLDGQNLQRYRNDIWTSTDGVNWTEVTVSGNLFAERWIHETIEFDGKLWVIGGDDSSGNRFNDVWISDDAISWTQINSNAPFAVRDSPALFIHNNKLWISGGSNNDGILPGIWRTN